MTWETVAIVAFWTSAGLIVYSYGIYPIVLCAAARIWGRQRFPDPLDDARLPTVSLLIAAHNEESIIGARIENALAMDYPADKLEIVIASDGSDDNTNPIVERYANGHSHVRLLARERRSGKAAVLNAAVTSLRNEIIAFSDSNTFYEPQALRRLAEWFQDPTIGAACGKLHLRDKSGSRNVDGIYWRYETALKERESRLGALLGANGAIYAIRRLSYVPIPDNTIVDDLVIPLVSHLKTGLSIVFDPRAKADEETPETIGSEFRRRVRIGAGDFQSLGLLWPLLNPMRGWIALTFVSHKVLRWLCPFLAIIALTSCLPLARHPLYLTLFLLQSAFYGAGAIAAVLPTGGKVLRIMRISTMFSAMNLALLAGFWRWLLQSQSGTWARTPRSSHPTATTTGAG